MKITLKDGSVKEYGQSMAVIDVARDLSEGLARAATCAKVDGEVKDLRTVLDKDCELEILTFDSEEGKGAFNHTASHIMAQAVKRLYPETKLAIGPSIADGFYYDFDRPRVLLPRRIWRRSGSGDEEDRQRESEAGALYPAQGRSDGV